MSSSSDIEIIKFISTYQDRGRQRQRWLQQCIPFPLRQRETSLQVQNCWVWPLFSHDVYSHPIPSFDLMLEKTIEIHWYVKMEGGSHSINNNVLYSLITEESAIVESPIVIIIIPPAIIVSSRKVISTYRSTVLIYKETCKVNYGRCRKGKQNPRSEISVRSK